MLELKNDEQIIGHSLVHILSYFKRLNNINISSIFHRAKTMSFNLFPWD